MASLSLLLLQTVSLFCQISHFLIRYFPIHFFFFKSVFPIFFLFMYIGFTPSVFVDQLELFFHSIYGGRFSPIPFFCSSRTCLFHFCRSLFFLIPYFLINFYPIHFFLIEFSPMPVFYTLTIFFLSQQTYTMMSQLINNKYYSFSRQHFPQTLTHYKLQNQKSLTTAQKCLVTFPQTKLN